jgi:hypothetical protein
MNRGLYCAPVPDTASSQSHPDRITGRPEIAGRYTHNSEENRWDLPPESLQWGSQTESRRIPVEVHEKPTKETGFCSRNNVTNPSLKTRPRRAGNSMPPAARFGPSVRQTPGALSPQANYAAGAHCNRFATFQSSVEHRAARRTPAHSSTRLESAR